MDFSKAIKLRKEYIGQQFSHLNDMQQKAVFTIKGPLLILAGAGSGKTSVLINRISNMVRFGDSYNSEYFPGDVSEEELGMLECAVYNNEKLDFDFEKRISTGNIWPYNILAITFTNKAAGELKARLEASLGETSKDILASTFHSLCVKILRREGERLGYARSFTIYDTDDQKRVMKELMKDLGVDEKFVQIKTAMNRISAYKDKLISPEEAATDAHNIHEQLIVKCYAEYQARLKKANAMDFDDLIYQTVMLFMKYDDVLRYYQNRFRYIMVDEYQDTSVAQFVLIDLLAKGHNNLCVVGDDDQSIYRFRGATIENILSFEDNFPDCKVIRLEQNYRSTQNILSAANSVISNNEGRKGKTLWTAQTGGDRVKVYTLEREFDEAKNVVDVITENVKKGANLRDHAVLYRMNMQSSAVENALARNGFSYRVIGGHRFYDRREIKDLMAFIHIVINPTDNLRLKRIINVPARKIGTTTINAIQEIADEQGLSMINVLYNCTEYPRLSRSIAPLTAFLNIYKQLVELYRTRPMEEFVPNLIKITGYEDMLLSEGEEGKTRLENVGQLISNIQAYSDMNEEATLEMFIEEVALISDIDNYDENADAVTLMTIHSAKGLEFPYVFIVGLEEGIFPGEMSKYSQEEIEEERRLCYVGITRAKKRLYLSHARERMIFGQTKRPQPSRFLDEMDRDVCEMINKCEVKKPVSISAGYRRNSGGYGYTGGTIFGSQGTSYQRPAQKPVASSLENFAEGDRINHKAFGEGTVVKTTPMGNDILVEIEFDKVGKKKVMAKFSNIRKI